MQNSRHPALVRAPFVLAACLILCPLAAGAAQFAPSALFLSKEAVVEGETVLIHAIIQNDAATKFPGNLVIRDGEEQVGSVPTTLAANEVRAVSVSWTPGPGSHKVTAQLQDQGGTTIKSETKTFVVAAKPPAPPKASQDKQSNASNAAAVESSADIQAKIDGLSPAAGGALAPVFKLVDGSRTAIADVLDSQIANTKPKVAETPGVVAGTSTIQAPDQASWFSSIFNTVYLYILTALRFVVGSAGAFYPLLAVAFLYTLWRLYKKFRRA
ncbi:MAG: hypothetical protein KA066_01905 [Candidatus Pacebacteria bacterium]|nr:hypothetical protein [Candidatus Paceibacterota bacterium]